MKKVIEIDDATVYAIKELRAEKKKYELFLKESNYGELTTSTNNIKILESYIATKILEQAKSGD